MPRSTATPASGGSLRLLPGTALAALLALGLATAAQASGRGELLSVATRYFDPEFLERGRVYRLFGYAMFFLRVTLFLGLLWWAARRSWTGLLAAVAPLGRGRDWPVRLVFLTLLYGAVLALSFPFSVARYLWAREYGLRHDPWSAFLLDWVKGAGLGWVEVVVVGLLILGLFARWPRRWWAGATLAVGVLAVGWATLTPLVIDPLFNRIEPLPDGPLRAEVLDLAREGGVPVNEVWVSDASRRTRSVNAYFTGFGTSRRIVLYDTLVQDFEPREVMLVVAHEIGHWQEHHVYKGIALGLAGAALGFFLLGGVLRRWVAAGRGGVTRVGDPRLVFPAYALYFTAMLLSLPVSNGISRTMETRADAISIELTGDPETFIQTEVEIGRRNLSDVVPPRWIEWLLYTHPATARRILLGERALGKFPGSMSPREEAS